MMAFLGFVSLSPASESREIAVSWNEFEVDLGGFPIEIGYLRVKLGVFFNIALRGWGNLMQTRFTRTEPGSNEPMCYMEPGTLDDCSRTKRG